jgi:pimeloyl-ACP methyl ester carboxylesterase
MKTSSLKTASCAVIAATFLFAPIATATFAGQMAGNTVQFNTAQIDGLNIAYREAGDPANPTVLLLHGFPTSSHMFRNLIPELAGNYHVIAPDYPGFGASDMPDAAEYEYSFANTAAIMTELLDQKNVNDYAVYLMDYGAPVGFRMFAEHPERVSGFII